MTNPPGHLWRDKWTALSGPLSRVGVEGVALTLTWDRMRPASVRQRDMFGRASPAEPENNRGRVCETERGRHREGETDRQRERDNECVCVGGGLTRADLGQHHPQRPLRVLHGPLFLHVPASWECVEGGEVHAVVLEPQEDAQPARCSRWRGYGSRSGVSGRGNGVGLDWRVRTCGAGGRSASAMT